MRYVMVALMLLACENILACPGKPCRYGYVCVQDYYTDKWQCVSDGGDTGKFNDWKNKQSSGTICRSDWDCKGAERCKPMYQGATVGKCQL